MQNKHTLDRTAYFTRQYSDPVNYPYGFSRSGDFSISESNALQQYGVFISALVDGSYTATTPEDKSLHDVATGKKAADNANVVERAWDKYQQRIHRKKGISIYGSAKVSHDDESDETNVEEDIDNDL